MNKDTLSLSSNAHPPACNVQVYANDLNPVAVNYLRINGKLNKVGSYLDIFCLDARAFITMMAGGQAAL